LKKAKKVSRDEHFMCIALEEAKKSLERGKLPVGAVIVSGDGKIIASGGKMDVTHSHTDHAEKNIIEELLESKQHTLKNLRGMTVYTTLEPCMMCFGLMLNVRVTRVVYALEDAYGGALFSFRPDDFPPRHKRDFPSITSGVLREETRALFKEYFEQQPSDFWKDSENPLVALCCKE